MSSFQASETYADLPSRRPVSFYTLTNRKRVLLKGFKVMIVSKYLHIRYLLPGEKELYNGESWQTPPCSRDQRETLAHYSDIPI